MDSKDWSPQAKKHFRLTVLFVLGVILLVALKPYYFSPELTPEYLYDKICDLNTMIGIMLGGALLLAVFPACTNQTRKGLGLKAWTKEDLDEMELRIEELEKEAKKWR